MVFTPFWGGSLCSISNWNRTLVIRCFGHICPFKNYLYIKWKFTISSMHSHVMDEFMRECFKIFYWLTVQKPLFCSKRNILRAKGETRENIFIVLAPLLPSLCGHLAFGCRASFFGRSQRLPVVVQQFTVILAFLWEEVSSCPSPSYLRPYFEKHF